MAEISVTNIIKRYGSLTVLDFEEWKITDGNYWIKGGNGTGKSTLFKIIAGQIPFRGEVTINNTTLNKMPVAYREMISYAEAEPQYPLFITGDELLNYYLSVRKADRKIADEVVDLFKMSDFMDNKIGTYSSGMLKKLSLVCAFTGNVQLYILDEPLITIDNNAAQVLYQLIKSYHKQGKTFLISSHQEIKNDDIDLKGIFKIQNHRIVPC